MKTFESLLVLERNHHDLVLGNKILEPHRNAVFRGCAVHPRDR
jgi:hypothetical protein